jgi:hypothetical protein
MTGAYIRVKRNNDWVNVEIEHLTETELMEQFSDKPADELVKWINMLCAHIQKIEPLLKDLERDGIISFVSGKDKQDEQEV